MIATVILFVLLLRSSGTNGLYRGPAGGKGCPLWEGKVHAGGRLVSGAGIWVNGLCQGLADGKGCPLWEMKVVIDTNVLVSAAWRDRSPEAVVLWIAFQDDWDWVVSQEILDEYKKKKAGRVLEGRTWDEMPVSVNLGKA